jgi:hypothetical protein
MYKTLAASLFVGSLTACGTLTPFGAEPARAIPADARPLFAGCTHYLEREGPGYVQSQWAYCGDASVPDRYWYRHYQGVTPAIEAVMQDLAADNPFPGAPVVERHDEDHDVAGEKVEWLHVTMRDDAGAAVETLFGARTRDKHVFVCSVDQRTASGGAREAAQQACPKAIDAMVRAIR